MKIRILSLKEINQNIIYLFIFLLLTSIIIFLSITLINQIKNNNIEREIRNLEQIYLKNSTTIEFHNNEDKTEEKNLNTQNFDLRENEISSIVESNLVSYTSMPNEINGYRVIGKLEIEKLGISTYILDETNKESLNIAVTKLYGPDVNKIGNLCITGHNYNNSKMFGFLKKLELQDEIILTDIYDRKQKYIVYDIQTVNPKDLYILDQNTDAHKKLTLITCTTGATSRIVVKAIEDYD